MMANNEKPEEVNTLPRLSASSPDGFTHQQSPNAIVVETLGGTHQYCPSQCRMQSRSSRWLSQYRSRCQHRAHNMFLALASVIFCIASRKVFVDWTPEIHIPYDISTTMLVAGLVSRLLADISATRARRSRGDQVLLLQIQLSLVVTVVLFNTSVMRQVLRISGHVSSAAFVAVYASTTQTVEKKTVRQVWMPWVLFGTVVAVRRFGCLDCCWHPQLKRRFCNGTATPPAPCRTWEDPLQTQIPIVVGLGEAIFCLFTLCTCSNVLRAWRGRHRNARWHRRIARCRGKRLPAVAKVEDDMNAQGSPHKDEASATMLSSFDV